MSNDPLQTLQAALAVPADSEAQASLLQTLRENLEAQPTPIPILCSTLIKTVTGAGDSLLKRWVIRKPSEDFPSRGDPSRDWSIRVKVEYALCLL